MGAHGWSDDAGIVRHGEAALEAGPTCRMSVSGGSQEPLLAEAGHCIVWPGGAGLVSGLSWSRVAVLGVGGGFFGVAE